MEGGQVAVRHSWNTMYLSWGEGEDTGSIFYCPPPHPPGCLSSAPLLQPSGSKPSLSRLFWPRTNTSGFAD